LLKKLTLNLIVEDVNRTVEFYQNTLTCFELVDSEPKEGQLNWAMVRCGDVQLMFETQKSLSETFPIFQDTGKGGSLVIYIELDNIEWLYKIIKDKVIVVKELFPASYGMLEFAIRDCNGFVLVFAEWVGVKEFFEKSVKKKSINRL